MTKEKTKILLVGIVGGIIGTIMIAGAIFGFFFIMNRIHTVKITCLPQQEVTKSKISCEILETKDRGSILKLSEMVSPPTNENELEKAKDIKTDGKFIEARVRIKNNGKDSLSSCILSFIDQEERIFSSSRYGPIKYWLPEEESSYSAIIPGTEKEIIEIFEVSKNSELSKLKIKFFKPSKFLD